MTEDTQVNPEEVKAFLQKNASELPERDKDQFADKVVDLDDVKRDLEDAEKEHETLMNSVEEERNKVFEPDKSSLAHLSSWVFDKKDLQVEVNDLDKALYIKSLLNDTELTLEINLMSGLSIKCRALTNFDLEVVFFALKKDSEEGLITGPAQYASRVQQAAAAMQIIKYGDKDMPYISFSKPFPNLEDAAAKLRSCMQNELGTWGWAKWQAGVTALRIFETKLTMCNENIRNGNFWQPAGTA